MTTAASPGPAPTGWARHLPNWITVFRIGLVPLFLVLAYADDEGDAVAAVIVFVIASLSDLVDGYLARRWRHISRLGQFLDPTADKLLVGAALVALVSTRDFPLWAAVLIAVRELAVQVLRTEVVRRGGTLPSSGWGKAKTVTQMIMIGWWLLPIETAAVHWVLLVLGLAITVWSGAGYFLTARQRGAVPS